MLREEEDLQVPIHLLYDKLSMYLLLLFGYDLDIYELVTHRELRS